jgi:hypothetical protein
MIHRLLYYSQLRKGLDRAFQQNMKTMANTLQEEWTDLGLMNVSVFLSDPYVCVYAECASVPAWDWPSSFEHYLEKWPTDPTHDDRTRESMLYRLSIPMVDVFHDGVPEDSDSWRGSLPVDERIGSIARLKPEMVSSYIFYHYQLQEETPDSFNSTYIIGSMGRLLFSYHEVPTRISEAKRQGLLTTKNSPDNWHEVMYPHFQTWDEAAEGKELWRKMVRLM